MAQEREIQTESVKYIRALGHVVRVLSAPMRVLKQVAGLPDVFVFAPNTVWMLEFKSKDGRLEGSQLAFYESIRRFLGPNLRYSVPRSVQEVIIEAAQLPPAY